MDVPEVPKSPLKPVASVDPLVQVLVNIANGDGLCYPVTLQVGGILVSGTLIGFRQYLERFAELFAEPYQSLEGYPSEMRDLILGFGAPAEGSSQNEAPTLDCQFIHIGDAKFFSAAGEYVPHSGSALWRGRISEIDGFFLGDLQRSS